MKTTMDNWKIIRDFILQNEDDFMKYLEDEHEIEGSDMDFVLSQVEERLTLCGSEAR